MQPHMGMNALMAPNGAMQPMHNGAVQGFGLMQPQPVPLGAQPSAHVAPGMPNLNGPSFF